jgi:hypothetical protein
MIERSPMAVFDRSSYQTLQSLKHDRVMQRRYLRYTRVSCGRNCTPLRAAQHLTPPAAGLFTHDAPGSFGNAEGQCSSRPCSGFCASGRIRYLCGGSGAVIGMMVSKQKCHTVF